jgi:hypothetical protein
MFALFLPIVDFVPVLIFLVISFRICNIINATKIKIKQIYQLNKQKPKQKNMINTKKQLNTENKQRNAEFYYF